jgi:hypothetical protein
MQLTAYSAGLPQKFRFHHHAKEDRKHHSLSILLITQFGICDGRDIIPGPGIMLGPKKND